MKVFASHEKARDIHQRQPASGKQSPAHARVSSPLSTLSLIQQRHPPCACGGGCPRCQENLTLQAKLAISRPSDPYEQEADRVADRVMRMPESTAGHQGDAPSSPDYQALAIPLIQPQTRSGSTIEVSPSLTADIESAKSGGQPLAHSVRDFFEPRFSRDFSRVRVHPDFQGSQDLKALAFTTGQDIFFGQGRYSPDTAAGQTLLAHELTHVIQQSGKSSGKVIQCQYDDAWYGYEEETQTPLLEEGEEDWWYDVGGTRDVEREKELAKQELEKPISKGSSPITYSVGRGGDNFPVDVRVVQTLLKRNQDLIEMSLPEPTGRIDTTTIQAIEEYQRLVLGFRKPDGRVDPSGKTIEALQKHTSEHEEAVDLLDLQQTASDMALECSHLLSLESLIFNDLTFGPSEVFNAYCDWFGTPEQNQSGEWRSRFLEKATFATEEEAMAHEMGVFSDHFREVSSWLSKSILYLCPGTSGVFRIPGCDPGTCDPTPEGPPLASTCAPSDTIAVCPGFWTDIPKDEGRAIALIHEAFHACFGFHLHPDLDRGRNPACYQGFVNAIYNAGLPPSPVQCSACSASMYF